MLQRDRTLVTSAIPRCTHQLGFEAAAVTSRPMLVDLSMLLKDNCNSFCIAAISHDVKDDLCGFDRNVLQLRVGCWRTLTLIRWSATLTSKNQWLNLGSSPESIVETAVLINDFSKVGFLSWKYCGDSSSNQWKCKLQTDSCTRKVYPGSLVLHCADVNQVEHIRVVLLLKGRLVGILRLIFFKWIYVQ